MKAAIEALRVAGFRVNVVETRARGDARRLAAGVDPAAVDALVVAGGDGTVNEVLIGLAQFDDPPPLAILPLGTANVLAAELAMPAQPQAFARALAQAVSCRAYFGVVNGHRFSLMASIGLDADVVAAVDTGLKRRLGKTAYVAAAMQVIERSPGRRVRVQANGEHYDVAAAIACKSRFYAGRHVVASEARVTRPGLHLCLIDHCAGWGVMRLAAYLGTGRFDRAPGVTLLPASEIVFEGEPGRPIQADGDIVAHGQARITLDESCIRLLSAEPYMRRTGTKAR